MKFLLTTTPILLSLTLLTSALPLPQALDIAYELPEPAMTRSGVVVAFDHAAGMGTKRSPLPEEVKRNDDTIPAMTVGGAVVPFENDGSGGEMGTKRSVAEFLERVGRKRDDDSVPAMTVGGAVVPFENDGGSDMGT